MVAGRRRYPFSGYGVEWSASKVVRIETGARYPDLMAAETSGNQGSSAPVSTDDLLAGIPITAEGRARARRKLDEVTQNRTPERTNALRAKLGLPPKPSAA